LQGREIVLRFVRWFCTESGRANPRLKMGVDGKCLQRKN
jgi:hypothetical protein